VRQLHGIAASPGIAIGPLFKVVPSELQLEAHPASDLTAEWGRLEQALTTASEQLRGVREKALQATDPDTAAIFDAQAAMLSDPELLSLCKTDLRKRALNVEVIWRDAVDQFARRLEALSDPYIRARAADLRDAAGRVLRLLAGAEGQAPASPSVPSIVAARDLTPSDTVTMDKRMVLGFCTAEGGETSHTAILARTLGIPAVVGLGADLLVLQASSQAILDGTGGVVTVDPDTAAIAEWKDKNQAEFAMHAQALSSRHEPAVTLDGTQVDVIANIGSLEDAHGAMDMGAEGVGLLRTEFLYLQRDSLPGEVEQLREYTKILDVFGDRPVVLRTLDIGGDKAVPYLDLTRESNPFLGLRGLRLCLARPELVRPQLLAALQAGVGHNLRLMFPMVSTLEEVLAARRLLEECRAALQAQAKTAARTMEVGIMVEVPSAALLAARIAPHVDFFSIGTNDLTQYTLAADRTNAQVAGISNAFSPAVLTLIDSVIRAAHDHGKRVAVCGELAGQPIAIPILLGFGLDEFSMSPPAIPLAKEIMRGLSRGDCRHLASETLGLENAQQVRDFVQKELPWISG
jgi:phosphotransferase system enzyme I (PtsI)